MALLFRLLLLHKLTYLDTKTLESFAYQVDNFIKWQTKCCQMDFASIQVDLPCGWQRFKLAPTFCWLTRAHSYLSLPQLLWAAEPPSRRAAGPLALSWTTNITLWQSSFAQQVFALEKPLRQLSARRLKLNRNEEKAFTHTHRYTI